MFTPKFIFAKSLKPQHKPLNSYQDFLKTSEGYWLVRANDDYISSIDFDKNKPQIEIKANIITNSLIRQLIAYFEGHTINFDVPLGMEEYTDFQKSVWNALLEVPYGTTISYSILAKRLGNTNSVRAVANANAKNPFPIVVPCHRVIGKNGDLTGYAHGLELKAYLLELEGAIKEKQLSLF